MRGAYILLLRASKDFSKRIGSLGRMHFEKGNYVYVGSAQSSLFPRFERHYAKRKKRLHWHIDYLTTSKNFNVKRAVYSSTNRKEFECRLSSKVSELPFSKPILSFGSTDCKYGCKSHLFMLKSTEKQAIASIIQIYRELDLRPLVYQRLSHLTK